MKVYCVEHIYGDYNNLYLVKANNQKEAINILYNHYCNIGLSGKNVENGYKPVPKCELIATEVEKMFDKENNLVGLN